MKSRRSFLTMLGLGAVAAPVAAQAAQAAQEIATQPEISIDDGPWTALGNAEAIDNYGMRVWIEWAKNARGV